MRSKYLQGLSKVYVLEDSKTMPSNNKDSSSGQYQVLWIFLLTVLSYMFLIAFFPVLLLSCSFFAIVNEYERAVVFRFGKLRRGRALGPGLVFLLPFADVYQKVDLRTRTYRLSSQKFLSKDSVTVFVDAVVVYRIQDPVALTCTLKDDASSTQYLAASILRSVLGTKLLSEIVKQRQQISELLKTKMEVATGRWGIEIEHVAIKDVKLPCKLQRIMAAEAEATRRARANVIAAEGEREAARKLTEAGHVIDNTPMALELSALNTFHTVSSNRNHTIVIPIPTDLLN